MLKTQDLRELTRDELLERENELAEQLFTLRLQKSTGQIENPAKVGETRRDLARVLTVLREKQEPAS